MKIRIVLLICLLVSLKLFSQNEVVFKVSGIPVKGSKYIGIRGNTPPLSWDRTIFLDKDGDQYTTSVQFDLETKNIEYKYVLDNGKKIQWEGISNRSEIIKSGNQIFKNKWDIEKIIDPRTLPKLSVEELSQDFEVIRNAILKVHPGLYRYNDSVHIAKNLSILKNTFSKPLTYAETFLAMAKFIATIQCDHTLVSSWNQETIINSIIHRQRDKLPFTFQWIDNRMIVIHNVSESPVLQKGSEIVSINEVPVEKILQSMLPYITSDGATEHNKISKAQIEGYSFRYNAFDVLYPLLYPIENGQILLKIKEVGDTSADIKINTLTREERSKLLIKKYSDFPKSPEDLWEFKVLKDTIAYLKIGSFDTDNFKKDWKLMLKNAFKEFRKQKIAHLILDIRENQGGLDDASYELAKYLYHKNSVVTPLQNQSRFLDFPEDVKPYITTWDYWFYNLKDDEHYKKDIYYVFPRDAKQKKIQPSPYRFEGKVFLLTGAKNVSGAFYFARFFKESKKAVLIGQETGGNQNGINGGAILFLKPPNSRININLPVIGTFSTEKLPNKGIEPDILVKKTVNAVIQNKDIELEKALELIKN